MHNHTWPSHESKTSWLPRLGLNFFLLLLPRADEIDETSPEFGGHFEGTWDVGRLSHGAASTETSPPSQPSLLWRYPSGRQRIAKANKL